MQEGLDESGSPTEDDVVAKLLRNVPPVELVALCRALGVNLNDFSCRSSLLSFVLQQLKTGGCPLYHVVLLMPSWLKDAQALTWAGRPLPETLFFYRNQPHSVVPRPVGEVDLSYASFLGYDNSLWNKDQNAAQERDKKKTFFAHGDDDGDDDDEDWSVFGRRKAIGDDDGDFVYSNHAYAKNAFKKKEKKQEKKSQEVDRLRAVQKRVESSQKKLAEKEKKKVQEKERMKTLQRLSENAQKRMRDDGDEIVNVMEEEEEEEEGGKDDAVEEHQEEDEAAPNVLWNSKAPDDFDDQDMEMFYSVESDVEEEDNDDDDDDGGEGDGLFDPTKKKGAAKKKKKKKTKQKKEKEKPAKKPKAKKAVLDAPVHESVAPSFVSATSSRSVAAASSSAASSSASAARPKRRKSGRDDSWSHLTYRERLDMMAEMFPQHNVRFVSYVLNKCSFDISLCCDVLALSPNDATDIVIPVCLDCMTAGQHEPGACQVKTTRPKTPASDAGHIGSRTKDNQEGNEITVKKEPESSPKKDVTLLPFNP